MTECLVPCIIGGRPLQDETGGKNQPVGGLAFQCWGDAEPGWLEVNICEPCLHIAVVRRRVLHGDRASRRARASYRLWQWPKRQ